MKSLNVIQTLAKIGKILSKIAYIFWCVITGIGAVALISYAVLGDFGIKIGGTTITGLVQSSADISAANICVNIAVSLVMSIAYIVVTRRSCRYFEHELRDGTPFTYDGAKELLQLGIYVIVLPICAVIICSIAIAATGHFFPEITKPHWLENATSTGAGIAMIIISVLCKYGAELSDKSKNDDVKPISDGQGNGAENA